MKKKTYHRNLKNRIQYSVQFPRMWNRAVVLFVACFQLMSKNIKRIV